MKTTNTLDIPISDRQTIAKVQDLFNTRFSFLKLEFFSKPHGVNQGSEKKYMHHATTLSQCRNRNTSGKLHIDPAMSVGQLEQEFYNQFGLSVQVFRKSGRVWLETIATDDWTLEEQNAEGESLSNYVSGRVFHQDQAPEPDGEFQ